MAYQENNDVVSRTFNKIQEGVYRLQETGVENPRAYHQAVVDLDHVLLSDLANEAEAAEIVMRAQRNNLLGLSQILYRSYETLLEESFTKLALACADFNLLGGDNITHNYLMRYYNLAANEIKLARIQRDDRVLFIGSGPFPITAIEYARQTGCMVDCVEVLPDKATISRDIVNRLGMTGQLQVYTADGQSFSPKPYSVVLVGVLAQPKQNIIDNIERDGRDNTKVLARTTMGLRQFVYYPAEFRTIRYTSTGTNQARNDQVLSTILLR
ncbi:hypothetical protein HYS91_05865 [Candidatus Daviesbacteria bacterium]|nr:hypothetical protein [Candidatus Daviesbacteria bacterium]